MIQETEDDKKKKRKYHQGKYYVTNKGKYRGDSNNVFYRSSWELEFLKWCDKTPKIIEFSSEEIVIPYKSPIDNKFHRYFVDMWLKIQKTDNEVKEFIVEIKPYSQTLPPEKKKRKTRKYLNEVFTWGINNAKWQAANDYARKKDMQFIIASKHKDNSWILQDYKERYDDI